MLNSTGIFVEQNGNSFRTVQEQVVSSTEKGFSYLRTGTQFPQPSSLLYGKMGPITLFFFQMGILNVIQHFMHEILVGSSHYFTSYCNESRHICETLKGLFGQ